MCYFLRETVLFNCLRYVRCPAKGNYYVVEPTDDSRHHLLTEVVCLSAHSAHGGNA